MDANFSSFKDRDNSQLSLLVNIEDNMNDIQYWFEKLKVVEDDNKVLKRELGVTQNKLAATHKKLDSLIDDFKDQWSFAKEYVKQALGKNLDGVYARFQEKQQEKQQEASRRASRDDLSRQIRAHKSFLRRFELVYT